MYCNTLNYTYQIIVISTSYWKSGIKRYKIFAFRIFTNFVVSQNIYIQLIELNLLLHSKVERSYNTTLNCILNVSLSTSNVASCCNMLNYISEVKIFIYSRPKFLKPYLSASSVQYTLKPYKSPCSARKSRIYPHYVYDICKSHIRRFYNV